MSKQIKIEFTSEFKRNLRHLIKKYRTIKKDLESIISKLEQGEIIGDKIPDVKFNVYKLRVKNSDLQRGKSGGYRVIYYFKQKDFLILVTIYSKTEQGNISSKQIREIIECY